jgi:hypothetical protein
MGEKLKSEQGESQRKAIAGVNKADPIEQYDCFTVLCALAGRRNRGYCERFFTRRLQPPICWQREIREEPSNGRDALGVMVRPKLS